MIILIISIRLRIRMGGCARHSSGEKYSMLRMMYGRLTTEEGVFELSRMCSGVLFCILVVVVVVWGGGLVWVVLIILSLTRREVVHADDVFWPLGDGRRRVCAFENV